MFKDSSFGLWPNYNEIVFTAKSHKGRPNEADEEELVHVEVCAGEGAGEIRPALQVQLL